MWLLVLAMLSGVSFTFIGIGYRLGQPRGVAPVRAALVIGVVGSISFAVKAGGVWPSGVPAKVVTLGIVTGLTQYLTIKFVRRALAMGPLSALWCVVSVGFVPAVIYAALFLPEHITWYHYAGVAAGVLCVLAGSAEQGAADTARGRGSRVLYGLVLFAIFLFNGIAFICVKELASSAAVGGSNLMKRFGDTFIVWEYLTIGAPALIDALVGWRRRPRLGPWLGCGLIAAAGSMGGLWLLVACAELNTAVVFTLSSILSILTGALVSVLFFGEKVRPALFLMLALGMVAVILVNLDKLL